MHMTTGRRAGVSLLVGVGLTSSAWGQWFAAHRLPAPQPVGAPAPPAASRAIPQDARPGDPDPQAERIVDELERAAGLSAPDRPVGEPVAPDPAPPRRAAAREARARRGQLLPEGTYLPSRRGRMARNPAGDWVFVFDSGPRGRTEPPMVLMPSRTLEEMERLAGGQGEAAILTVSGQVFVYKGQNYLLPSFVVPERRGELTPLQ
ncbi:MAG TPA: hypothetical protein VD963_10620 [Phycisphaerales bacterium]|nr:hypothetical protein [Phycisphaerales bacterium]